RGRSRLGWRMTLAVVVTGSTQGIGYGYAREFLRRGHRVMVSGRDPRRVDASVQKLQQETAAGERVAGCACDVADIASVQRLWDTAVQRFGQVDIWVHNAGYARSGPRLVENTPSEIEAMVRSNVIGSMNAAQVALAGMQKRGSGKLYLTLGGGGGTGRIVPGMTVYSTTKRAVRYFADTLLKERRAARDRRVLIGTISPGVNISEGMLREINALPLAERARALRQLNFIGDHVETTTAWIVEQILANTRQGHDIVWLTAGRLLRRGLGLLFGRRDVLSRYGLKGTA
ncbi:MAG: SDR family oxidoreductase, partial [Gammaproteobacteria bacterium]|nr:SDR family oxidoreductase [Gammaproteobacteria bacterium]